MVRVTSRATNGLDSTSYAPRFNTSDQSWSSARREVTTTSGRVGMSATSASTSRHVYVDQPFLLPPSLQDWLLENQLARFVADVVRQLDLSEIYGHYEREE